MKSVSEVKVGALTLGGAVLLAGMISFLGAFSLFDSGYDLHVTYPSVNGLLTGGQVRYAGVPVGTVKDMKVDGSHVVVTMHVKKEVQIPMDSSFPSARTASWAKSSSRFSRRSGRAASLSSPVPT